MPDLTIFTIQNFIYAIAFIFACYELYDKGGKIVGKITAKHDRAKKWDEMAEKVYQKYDTKFNDIEKRIEDNHIETEAKVQQIQAELFILTQCMSAVLDGLKQMNCNGKVTEAQKLLDEYLIKRAHE